MNKLNLSPISTEELATINGGTLLNYIRGWIDFKSTKFAEELGKYYIEHPEDAPPC